MGVRRRDVMVAAGSATATAGLSGLLSAISAGPGPRSPKPYYGGPNSAILPERGAPNSPGLRVVWAGGTRTGAVALTFDDGPHPQWTPQVLRALHDADVPATFFLQGKYVEQYPTVHAPSPGRHELGNHTWDHPDLSHLTVGEAQAQLSRTSDVIEQAHGVRPTLFRPPYGHLGGATLAAAAQLSLSVMLWSAQFNEAAVAHRPDDIVEDTARQCAPGSIILGHDRGPQQRRLALDRLPQIIEAVKAKGLQFVTVSDLIASASP